MASSPKLSDAAAEFLSWAADDYTEVFVLRDILRRGRERLSGKKEKEAALGIIRELLQADLVRVGEIRRETKGIDYWDDRVSALIARLEAYWTSTAPQMGEGPWFYATDKGKLFVDSYH